MSAFPTHPDQLTPEWLSGALGREIEGFSVELLGEGAGLLAWVLRLRLEAGDGGSGETVMAKFPSPSADNRAVASGFDMYQREVGFYLRHRTLRRRFGRHACLHAETSKAEFRRLRLAPRWKIWAHLRIGDQVEGCSLVGGARGRGRTRRASTRAPGKLGENFPGHGLAEQRASRSRG